MVGQAPPYEKEYGGASPTLRKRIKRKKLFNRFLDFGPCFLEKAIRRTPCGGTGATLEMTVEAS